LGNQRREELQWKAGNVRPKSRPKKTTYSKISGCGGYRPTFAVFNEIQRN